MLRVGGRSTMSSQPPPPSTFERLMALNVFKFCTGLKVIGSIMILVVLGVVGLSYYAVVITSYGPRLLAGEEGATISFFVLLAFHVLLGLLLWCYFATVFTDPGGVPPGWTPAEGDEDVESQTAPITSSSAGYSQVHGADSIVAGLGDLASGGGAGSDEMGLRGGNGAPGLVGLGGPAPDAGQPRRVRYCRKCSQFKPPRCHHCSVCGRCILKMDHHCVWVVNCVGALNYKSFLLFLLYTLLETSLVSAALIPDFIQFFANPDEEPVDQASAVAATFLGFVLNLAFALSVLGFLAMHVSLVLNNTTTIEAYEKKAGGRWKFDLGRKRNFEQVFGTSMPYWFVPLYTEDDQRRLPGLSGLHYPLRGDLMDIDY